MTAADDMKAAFDIHHEAYRQGFLDGAQAMQKEAARIASARLRTVVVDPERMVAWFMAASPWLIPI